MEDGKKVIILVGFLSVLLYIYCSFDDYDDYNDCNKICQKMSETECETLSIVEINEKSWTTIMLFPGTGKSMMPLMINHNGSTLKLSNGDEITVEREDITKEMFIKKKPIYRPEKTKGEKEVLFEPVFDSFDYEIVE